MRIVARPPSPQSRSAVILEFHLDEADLKATNEGEQLDHFTGRPAKAAQSALEEYAQVRRRVERTVRR